MPKQFSKFTAEPNSDFSEATGSTAAQMKKAVHILRIKQVVERTSLLRASVYVLFSRDPTFPRKIQLTVRSVRVYEHELDAWLSSRTQLSAVA